MTYRYSDTLRDTDIRSASRHVLVTLPSSRRHCPFRTSGQHCHVSFLPRVYNATLSFTTRLQYEAASPPRVQDNWASHYRLNKR
ncbi:hypothetical protein E2C01_070271 [Portunus trituberculatus]|uniref:Uncharacterized protein n=1 Tax=Portunus trituberculatus TaxID=210409 RepID=A0A5B7I4Y8_PORTR|nr:hypothetical protein [Portunus trituberculatus]